ncbi:hypothetical protein [Flavobacterium sp. ZS1P14]|uniref:hypothetical protein n=1 Tax=Flavobacterium sp. ZS1P14 TaxID=3401729 RepID=UPI003AAB01A3
MEKDIFKKEEELINERLNSLKKDDNVVHLKYIGEINEADLKEISDQLSTANLELSTFDSSRKTVACLEDFSFVTYLAISQPLIIEFLKGISTNAGWDVMKQTIIFVRSKILGKKYYRVTSKTQEEKEITFGVKVKLDKNTGFDFELKGNLSDEIIGESLDKILDFLKTQEVNPKYEHPLFVEYSKKEKKWIPINVLEEMRKKRKSNSDNKNLI